MSIRRKVLFLCFYIALGGIITGVLLMMRAPTDFTTLEPIAKYDSYKFKDFVSELKEKERGTLGNKVYAVNGEVESLLEFGFILRGGIVCTTADSTDLGFSAGDEVSVKGRFISYDDLFEEIRLDYVVTF